MANKKLVRIISTLLLVSLLIVSLVSTSWFGDVSNKITGEVSSNYDSASNLSALNLANVDDLNILEVTVKVLDGNNNPVKNANVKLYNRNHSIYFPINTQNQEYNGAYCDKVFKDDNYYAVTDDFGEAKMKIVEGDYKIFALKEINSDNRNKEVLYLEKDAYVNPISVQSQVISLKSEKEINITFKIDSDEGGDSEFWFTSSKLKPGFSPFHFGFFDSEFKLYTNNEAQISLLVSKQAEDNLKRYIIVEDINPISIDTQLTIQKNLAELAEISFNSYGPENTPEPVGQVNIELKEFFIQNFGINFPTNPSTTVYITPQNVYIWFRIEKDGQSFNLAKRNGNILSLSAGQTETINFGGPFDLNFTTESYNPLLSSSTHFWFLVKDAYGNVLKGYTTKNPSAPQIVVKRESETIIDMPLVNYYPDIQIQASSDANCGDLSGCILSFSEDLHEFGRINLNQVPMKSADAGLMKFESENIEFILPWGLQFLESDWAPNFQKFYDQMYKLAGVKTTQKIPFRVGVGGADINWAPIDWPMVAYECQSLNYQCWFLITHEIGHPYTLNKPLSGKGIYNTESIASFFGITASIGVNRTIGEVMKSNYPILFKYLDNKSICYDKIEIIQTLQLYLNQRYSTKNVVVEVIKNWDSEYSNIYEDLSDKGYTDDESYGVIYSIAAGENVGPIFERFGLANSNRITSAIKEIAMNECLINKECSDDKILTKDSCSGKEYKTCSNQIKYTAIFSIILLVILIIILVMFFIKKKQKNSAPKM